MYIMDDTGERFTLLAEKNGGSVSLRVYFISIQKKNVC